MPDIKNGDAPKQEQEPQPQADKSIEEIAAEATGVPVDDIVKVDGSLVVTKADTAKTDPGDANPVRSM